MQVMKFGAVSVSDASRLRDVERIVKAAVDEDHALVVVCSALPSITDMLINAARSAASGSEEAAEKARRDLWSHHRALAERLVSDEWERESLFREWAEQLKQFDRITKAIATLGEPSQRGIYAVAALGERFIAALFAVVLRKGGVAARMVDAAELIVTDDSYGAAHVLPEESMTRIRQRLKSLTQSGIVPVIAGYIGATREGVVTTLGRGGGDYTAALIGAALSASEVCIWTDVDGILTADPKIVPQARTLPELSFAEAGEIATFGAEVLHPRTLEPLLGQDVVLRLRNALHSEHPGTAIVGRPKPTAQPARAIISARNLCMLSLATRGEGWAPDVAVGALAQLKSAGIEILTFAQSFSERNLTLCVRSTDADFARELLEGFLAREHQGAQPALSATPVALIAIISAGDSDLVPRALAALGSVRAHILALARAANAAHVSILVPEDETEMVVRGLHHNMGMA